MHQWNPFNPPTGVIVIHSAGRNLVAWIIPLGARLMQLFLQHNDQWRPLVLGFKDPTFYEQDTESIGAICGRYANRLEEGRIRHRDRWFELDRNHPLGHCIHGGKEGTGQQAWTLHTEGSSCVRALCVLPDAHMGFPGQCSIEVRYWIEDTALHFTIDAAVSKPCPLNFVQHAYFAWDRPNQYQLQLHASEAILTDHRELPLAQVDVTQTDTIFSHMKPLISDSQDNLPTIDRAFIIDRKRPSSSQVKAATLQTTDIRLNVSTTEPLIHVYTGQGIQHNQHDVIGQQHQPLRSICLESENFPNGPALEKDVWYERDRPYHQHTTWNFEILC